MSDSRVKAVIYGKAPMHESNMTPLKWFKRVISTDKLREAIYIHCYSIYICGVIFYYASVLMNLSKVLKMEELSIIKSTLQFPGG